MKSIRDLRRPSAIHYSIVAAAFTACLITIVFSWPDHHDRKRAIFPHPLKCCEIRVAHWVFVPGARAEREQRRISPATAQHEAQQGASTTAAVIETR